MKKIIDKQGRLFGKISVIDVIVIVIVLLLGAALYVKFNVLEITSSTGELEPITYVIKVSGVREYTLNNLEIGDILFDEDNDSGNSVGTITDIEAEQAMAASELTDGTYVMAEIENCYDITLTIEASGLVSSGRYFVNKNYEVNANSKRTFYTKNATFSATNMEIR
jgi:hypothetical protein